MVFYGSYGLSGDVTSSARCFTWQTKGIVRGVVKNPSIPRCV